MTADIVLLSPKQTPKGWGLVINGNNVTITTPCCEGLTHCEEDNGYRVDCKTCRKTILPKAEYSTWFPVSALEMARRSDYWYSWGLFWFGWEKFRITAEGF